MGSTSIRLAEILGALSRALDLTEGQPPGHCVRCCWIGVSIGRQIGLPEEQLRDLYYTLLLKDLGCSSNAARICDLYLADDIIFKRDFKQLDGSLPQVLRFVLSHTGADTGLAERFINILQNGGRIATDLIETRCQRGAEIARQMRFSEPVAEGILHLDEHWDGSGKPDGLEGSDISLFARIALLAQVVDVFQTVNGHAAALAETAVTAPGAGSTRNSLKRFMPLPTTAPSGRCWKTTRSKKSCFPWSPAPTRLWPTKTISTTLPRRSPE